ncbi:MAG TPA: glycosyltransferase family 4 protein [Chloroflexota bacterium]|nr:glycosyltransferase family 4 protein [Chloroflexota bacterium]
MQEPYAEMAPASGGASPRVAFFGSYPPRECGIGTFTYDLVNAYDAIDPSRLSSVIAINDYGQMYDYDLHDYQGRVRWQIDSDELQSYRDVADEINRSRVQVVNIQHEYGLFGGPDGEYLIDFMDRLQKPIVLTMHTVLPRPEGHFREVTQKLLDRADAVVVLARAAVPLIQNNYTLPPDRIHMIPHGIPNFTRKEAIRRRTKKMLRLGNRRLLSTFGLIGPSKAIEYVIRALPDIVAQHPDVLYLVIGETHPHIRQREGESYRNMLIDLARELGVGGHVRFNNRFLSNSELIRYLAATDVYLMAYLNKEQIVSGTLAYAVGCGKAVVATPFAYAEEMLSGGRGIIVPFRDSAAIADAVNGLLGNRRALLQMEEKAYRFSRPMVWPNVARMYLELFRYVSYFRAPMHAAL